MKSGKSAGPRDTQREREGEREREKMDIEIEVGRARAIIIKGRQIKGDIEIE